VVEQFLKLGREDQSEVLETVRAQTDRPTHLLEKDVWVVWTLSAIFDSVLADDLTLKGGTSLSKAYKVIDRFSEDVDLTCDIRKLVDGLSGDALPATRSQASKWTRAVRDRLPGWITGSVRPVIEAALARDQLDATIELGGLARDTLLLRYPALTRGTGCVSPAVVLEFGGRATGEPHQVMPVTCDMDGHIAGVAFPTASPSVMSVSRTFWEKATAAHVYCAQGRIRGERYARHWHDLAALGRSRHFPEVIADRAVATAVARHKSLFFVEKDAGGRTIDYLPAIAGRLRIVPEGQARSALAADYTELLADQVMLGEAMAFEQLLEACGDVEAQANRAAAP
jgi:hypothetical protein